MTRWVDLWRTLFAASVTHYVQQTAYFALIWGFVLLDWFIHLTDELLHYVIVQGLSYFSWGSIFSIYSLSSSLWLSWISVSVSDDLELDIFVDAIEFWGRLFVSECLVIGCLFDWIEIFQPDWLWIIWNLSHLVEKRNIVLFSFFFLVQKDVWLFKFKARASLL